MSAAEMNTQELVADLSQAEESYLNLLRRREELLANGELAYKEVHQSMNSLFDLERLQFEPESVTGPSDVIRNKEFAQAVAVTPLVELSYQEDDVRIFEKREDSRQTGAFKEQGAFWASWNALQTNPNLKGLVAFSAGNHGRGVTRFANWHNQQLVEQGLVRTDETGSVLAEDQAKLLQVHIFCPKGASDEKKRLLKADGAVLHDEDEVGNGYKSLEAAAADAQRFVQVTQLEDGTGTMHAVHPYEDFDVIVGQSNVIFSTYAQLRAAGVDTLATPQNIYEAGGGLGLGNGTALGLDVLVDLGLVHPESQVVVSQMENCDSAVRGLARLACGVTDMHGLFLDENGYDTFDSSADGTAVRVPSLSNLQLAAYLQAKGRMRFSTVSKAEVGLHKYQAKERGVIKEPAAALAGTLLHRERQAMGYGAEPRILIDVVSGGNESSATAEHFFEAGYDLIMGAGRTACSVVSSQTPRSNTVSPFSGLR